MPLHFGPLVLGSQLVIAVVDPILTIDVRKTCQAAAGVLTGVTSQNDVEICMSSEQRAREQIIKDWGQSAPADRTRCVQAGTKVYLPSYVEWLTCLEMETAVKRMGQEDKPSPSNRPQR
jgi:hypothetical protein